MSIMPREMRLILVVGGFVLTMMSALFVVIMMSIVVDGRPFVELFIMPRVRSRWNRAVAYRSTRRQVWRTRCWIVVRLVESFTRVEGCLSVLNKWSRNWGTVMWAGDKQRRSVTLLSIFAVIVVTGEKPSNS